ncbi:MAG: RDD family protein [Acidobacteria bacterium]|nr:RDD family protein [Acidobacteriota bacterium]
MKCPKCQGSEINLFGFCPVCSFEVSQSKEPARMPEEISPENEETEQNLQNIIDAVVSRQAASSSPLESDGSSYMPEAEEPAFLELDIVDESAADDLFVIAEDDAPDIPDAGDVVYVSDAVDDAEIEDAADVESAAKAGDAGDTMGSPYAANVSDHEGRLIFLSRTLSGLIDLFLVAIFSGIFLCVADYFTNAPMLSSMNAINFAALFLIIYFLYSIFFLGTNSQTIGMMVADLRVVGANENHFSISQVVRRSAMFLISLLGLGIGLLAGVFSRKCLCLHDRLSKTRVVRILERSEI